MTINIDDTKKFWLKNVYSHSLEKNQVDSLTLQRPDFFEGRKAGGTEGGGGYIDPPPAKSNENWQEHSSKKNLTVRNFADVSKESAKICRKPCNTKLIVTFD